MPILENGTRIVEMRFGIPVPRELAVSVQSSKNAAKDLEHLRANMNGVAVRIEDGARSLPEVDEELAKITRVRHQLKVEAGKAAIKPVLGSGRPDTSLQYGDLTVRLEKPGDVYFNHSMKDGFVTSLIACVVANH